MSQRLNDQARGEHGDEATELGAEWTLPFQAICMVFKAGFGKSYTTHETILCMPYIVSSKPHRQAIDKHKTHK